MQKRKKQKRWPYIDDFGYELVQRSTHEPSASEVSRVMAALGRKGGRIGGKRRLETMTAEERSRIAQNAAKVRWRKKKEA